MWSKSKSVASKEPYLQALRWLTVRDYSEEALKVRLHRLFPCDARVEAAVHRLKEEGYLNAARMRAACVRHGLSKGWGPLKIRAFLKQKGLSEENLEAVEEWQTVDWRALARSVVLKKKGSKEARARFLMGRGFPRSVVVQVLVNEHPSY